MNLNLEGKTALVTGGAQGIGEAIRLGLEAEGVFVTYSTRSLEQANRIGGSALVMGLEGVNNSIFNYDILINNAGSTLDVKDPHAPEEDFRKVMRLNYELPRELVERALPHMKKRKWGRIVNITSCSGMENRGPVAFCVAKAALTAYTRSMGRVLAIEEPGIVMSAVYPGVVYTEGGHWERILKDRPEHWQQYKKEIPVGRFGEPFEIANQVVFLCSDMATFHHGSIIGVDGGLSKGFAHHL